MAGDLRGCQTRSTKSEIEITALFFSLKLWRNYVIGKLFLNWRGDIPLICLKRREK